MRVTGGSSASEHVAVRRMLGLSEAYTRRGAPLCVTVINDSLPGLLLSAAVAPLLSARLSPAAQARVARSRSAATATCRRRRGTAGGGGRADPANGAAVNLHSCG